MKLIFYFKEMSPVVINQWVAINICDYEIMINLIGNKTPETYNYNQLEKIVCYPEETREFWTAFELATIEEIKKVFPNIIKTKD